MELTYARHMSSRFLQAANTKAHETRTWAAAVGYIVYMLATFVVVVYPIATGRVNTIWNVLLLATAYSAAVYVTFNLTNLYMFKAYTIRLAIIDMTYGLASLVFVALLTWLYAKNKYVIR